MDNTEQKILTPIKAIRAKCLDCTCDSAQEVRLCPCESCPLYPYRMGHNPNRKGMGGKFRQELPQTESEVTDGVSLTVGSGSGKCEAETGKTEQRR